MTYYGRRRWRILKILWLASPIPLSWSIVRKVGFMRLFYRKLWRCLLPFMTLLSILKSPLVLNWPLNRKKKLNKDGNQTYAVLLLLLLLLTWWNHQLLRGGLISFTVWQACNLLVRLLLLLVDVCFALCFLSLLSFQAKLVELGELFLMFVVVHNT